MNFSTTRLAYYFIHLFHKYFCTLLYVLGLGTQWGLSHVQGLLSQRVAVNSGVMYSGSAWELWEHVSGSCSGIRKEFPEEVCCRLRSDG